MQKFVRTSSKIRNSDSRIDLRPHANGVRPRPQSTITGDSQIHKPDQQFSRQNRHSYAPNFPQNQAVNGEYVVPDSTISLSSGPSNSPLTLPRRSHKARPAPDPPNPDTFVFAAPFVNATELEHQKLKGDDNDEKVNSESKPKEMIFDLQEYEATKRSLENLTNENILHGSKANHDNRLTSKGTKAPEPPITSVHVYPEISKSQCISPKSISAIQKMIAQDVTVEYRTVEIEEEIVSSADGIPIQIVETHDLDPQNIPVSAPSTTRPLTKLLVKQTGVWSTPEPIYAENGTLDPPRESPRRQTVVSTNEMVVCSHCRKRMIGEIESRRCKSHMRFASYLLMAFLTLLIIWIAVFFPLLHFGYMKIKK